MGHKTGYLLRQRPPKAKHLPHAGTATTRISVSRPEHVRQVKPHVRRAKLSILIGKAFYLCDSGARDDRDLYRAIFTYNRADWYLRKVLDQAALYAEALSNGAAVCAAHTPYPHTVTAPVVMAVWFACGELGKPYGWGGDGDAEGGWDCSGLTMAAHAAAGIRAPRVAQDQFDAGPSVPAGTSLLAGDLVFYGVNTASITHVGLAISSTHMVNAPEPGAVVRIDPIGRYLAATRPTSRTA